MANKNIPIDSSFLNNDPRDFSNAESTTNTTAPEVVEKKKAGRKPVDPERGKKKSYTKTINIAVELDVLEKVDIAKVKYGDNLTKYINALIEKDLEANFESYKAIYDMLNN